MTIEQARALRDALSSAIPDAEAAGSPTVDLAAALRQADDAARAELQAAIDLAGAARG